MKNAIGQRIAFYRKKAGLNQKEFAQKMGLANSSISQYESGDRVPSDEVKMKFCNFFKISMDDLMGFNSDPIASPQKGIKIPILGKVVAGIPVDVIENIEGYEEITPAMAAKGEYFALRVKEDSMAPYMMDGDIVIVRKQESINSGEIAIVLINGNEATVKEVKVQEDGLLLIGRNVMVYSPHFYNSQDVENLPVQIVGKVVEIRRSVP